MSDTLNKFVETVTIRARVAYVLGIAEHIISDIKTAWAWQNNASVSADVLNEYLMNEDEEGLLIHEQEASEDMVSAWVTITTAIAYVAWQAYQQKDEFPPGALCEDRYDIVEQIIDYASKTNVYDADFVNKLSEYLISSFRTKNRQAPKKNFTQRNGIPIFGGRYRLKKSITIYHFFSISMLQKQNTTEIK